MMDKRISIKPTLGGKAVYLGGLFLGRVTAAKGLWAYQRTMSSNLIESNYTRMEDAVQALLDEYIAEHEAFKEHVEASTEGIDSLRIDIPLVIRLLEFAREDAKDDMALHSVVQNMLRLQDDGVEILGMDNYTDIIGELDKQDAGIPDDVGAPRTHRDSGDLFRDSRIDVED